MKLNLGSGNSPIEGYNNLDAKTGDTLFPIISKGEFRYLDGTYEEVRASHVLEHFPKRQTGEVLKEWVRVLKPGGWLKIAVPDFRKIAEAYANPSPDNEWWDVQGYLMGGQTDELDYHKAIFDEDGLRDAFETLGLVDIQHWESEINDCAALPVSLNLMGRKPLEKEKPVSVPLTAIPKGVIQAVMSMPRLCFTSNMFCALNALVPLGIQLRNSTSVFWGQGLSECFVEAMKQEPKPKYILTLDYDTLFTSDDVLRLYAFAERHEAAAVIPLQMKRGCESPLFKTLKESDGDGMVHIDRRELEQDLLEVDTGHFGLTLLRVSALESLPKPYFLHTPSASGDWGDGRIDEDIYFWKNFRKAGFKVNLAPTVNVGHIEMVSLWANGQDMKPIYQNITDFNKTGKPEGIWGK